MAIGFGRLDSSMQREQDAPLRERPFLVQIQHVLNPTTSMKMRVARGEE